MRAGLVDVLGHLHEQRLDPVEGDGLAQPVEEVDGDVLAVQLEVVAVEHVGLDPAGGAAEGRVGADRDRRGEPGAVRTGQPAGVHAVVGDGGVGGRSRFAVG